MPFFSVAQKQDYAWMVGHDYDFTDSIFGSTVIDFNGGKPSANYFEQTINMNMFVCNASICDADGNLLFYSNGCDISDGEGNYLENGTDISPGYWHTRLCDEIARGYSAGYPSMVILPLPNNDSLYYLFHKNVRYVPGPPEDAFVDKLLYSVVKVTAGQKIVTQKNVSVMEDNLATGEMLAVKHANGSDWWLITPRRNSNQFYVFRFTEDGIVDTLTQTIGGLPPPQEEGSGQNTMSPDGSLMVRYYPYHDIMIYSFDRATGLFFNYRTASITLDPVFSYDGGCAISPNGRYLYIMAVIKAYQFDLWADDISATQTTVAEWDGFIGPIAITFYRSQLGPDCKIYVLGGGDTRYYHIIHNPDSPGLACNFEQRGLVLPTPSGASIPYFPNYRLGPIDNPGQPCTPTVSVSAGPVGAGAVVRVWPNPADQTLQIRYTSDQDAAGTLSLYNAVGQLVLQERVAAVSGGVAVSVGHLPEGIYYYFASGGYSGKVIIQH